MATPEKMAQVYIELRDKKKRIQTKHKDELAPINDAMEKLETAMLGFLNEQGGTTFKTIDNHGTIYRSTFTSVKVEDWAVAYAFLKENNLEHMLEQRLSKTAVAEYAQDRGQLPPGVSMTTAYVARVRK